MKAFPIRPLLAAFMALLLVASGLMISPAGRAQLPVPAAGSGGPTPSDPPSPEKSLRWWDPAHARPCGRLWCSDVVVPYLPLLSQRNSVVVAVAGSSGTAESTAEVSAERRSAAVSSNVDGIVRQLRRNQPADLRGALSRSLPKVAVGIENDQTVVYVVADPGLGLAQQTIATVTRTDATHAGVSEEALAERWRERFHRALTEALKGMAFDRRHPLARQLIVVAYLGLAVASVLLLRRLRRSLAQLQRRLQRHLQERESTAREQSLAAFTTPSPRTGLLSAEGLRSPQVLRQGLVLLTLLDRLLAIAMVAAVVTGIVMSFQVFPATRLQAVRLIKQAVALPLLWLALLVLQPLLVLGSDHLLGRWVRGAPSPSGTSRQELRLGTYAKVLRLASGVLCLVAGLYGTVLVLGVDPQLLAGAGVLAVAIGFLARNLLEDIVNGAMILITDRYAIGDVIRVGTASGFVEDMNLHLTRLRGSDGQLTSIPNRRIELVENLTQNWSRVDFSVRVSAAADPRRALEVIEAEAHRLWEDPTWQRLLREPPAVLGIDEISHDGTLIRVWISTLPLQQWLVGREFRLRIKLALQSSGIGLGVPQRQVTLQRPPAPAEP